MTTNDETVRKLNDVRKERAGDLPEMESDFDFEQQTKVNRERAARVARERLNEAKSLVRRWGLVKKKK